MQLRDLQFGLLDPCDDVDATLVVGQTRFCRADTACGAIEEPCAQQLLQLHDGFADGRTGKSKGATCLCVAAVRDDLHERIHRFQLVHLIVAILDANCINLSRLHPVVTGRTFRPNG